MFSFGNYAFAKNNHYPRFEITSCQLGVNFTLLIILEKNGENSVRKISKVHAICTYDLYIRSLHTIFTYDLHIRSVHTICTYDLYIRSLHMNCTYDLNIRSLHARQTEKIRGHPIVSTFDFVTYIDVLMIYSSVRNIDRFQYASNS